MYNQTMFWILQNNTKKNEKTKRIERITNMTSLRVFIVHNHDVSDVHLSQKKIMMTTFVFMGSIWQ